MMARPIPWHEGDESAWTEAEAELLVAFWSIDRREPKTDESRPLSHMLRWVRRGSRYTLKASTNASMLLV